MGGGNVLAVDDFRDNPFRKLIGKPGIASPFREGFAGLLGARVFELGMVKLIRREWTGKLVIKGLIAPKDLQEAESFGADAVILSNHGRRQLDGTISPLRVLRAALEEARDMPVMIDSGFRRGTDIVKAIALGAAFVFVGRPINYAATLDGERGVTHATTILGAQLRATRDARKSTPRGYQKRCTLR